MAHFIGDHLGTIVQFLLTAWLAKVARDFQVAFSIYGTRIDATREAMRRARVVWWLTKSDPNWTDTMNGMMDWHAVNEVYLTPAASRAFLDVHLWKGLQGSTPSGSGISLHKEFKKAQAGLDTLRVELLRFRKRPLGELLWDWGARAFRRKARDPKPRPKAAPSP